MSGKVINFYSFKGGVGRTVTLRNIASKLHKIGFKIAIIDMDLECPGHSLLESCSEKKHESYSNLSFLELAKGYVERLKDKDIKESSSEKADRFIVNSISSAIAFNKSLLQIPAFSNKKINQFTAEDFDEYVSYLKYLEMNQFVTIIGFMMEVLIETLKNNFDYILIDNRTGLAETSIWNLRKFADLTVWILTLSVQNIEGIRLTFNRYSKPLQDSISKDYTRFIFVANITPPMPKFIESNSDKLCKILGISISKLITIEYAPEPIFNEFFEKHKKIDVKYTQIVKAILEADENTTDYKKRYAKLGCNFFSINKLDNEFKNYTHVPNLIKESINYNHLIKQIDCSDNTAVKIELIGMLFSCLFRNKSFIIIVKLYYKYYHCLNSSKFNQTNSSLLKIIIQSYASHVVCDNEKSHYIAIILDKLFFNVTIEELNSELHINKYIDTEQMYIYLYYRLSFFYKKILTSNDNLDVNILLSLIKVWFILSDNTISLKSFIWPPQNKSEAFTQLDCLFNFIKPKRNTFIYNSISCMNIDIYNKSVPDEIVQLFKKVISIPHKINISDTNDN